MNFLEKLYTYVSQNGFQGTQGMLEDAVTDLVAANEKFQDIIDETFTFVKDNGYNLDFSHFETEYYKFWGKRPGGK